VVSFATLRRLPIAAALLCLPCTPWVLTAQDAVSADRPPTPMSLRDARAAALRHDPALRAAREDVRIALALERQAAARPNPSLAYGREATSRPGQSNAQDIAQIEWPFDVSGQRASRTRAARLRREAAEARVLDAIQTVDATLLRAVVDVAQADALVRLAESAFRTAREAQRVGDERERAGDLAGYSARRLRLEAGRYAARRAEAVAQQRMALDRLSMVTGSDAVRLDMKVVPPDDSIGNGLSAWLADVLSVMLVSLPPAGETHDSLVTLALSQRHDVIAAQRETQATRADAQLAARERIPMPVLSAGYKGERVQSGATPSASLSGFVAGFALPLPLLDRRGGIVAAAEATTSRTIAESDLLQRRVRSDVQVAWRTLRATLAEQEVLLPFVGTEAQMALRAVHAAYAEGEITLTEWLESIRAWQETQLAVLNLTADLARRRIELARAVGHPLFPLTESIR